MCTHPATRFATAMVCSIVGRDGDFRRKHYDAYIGAAGLSNSRYARSGIGSPGGVRGRRHAGGLSGCDVRGKAVFITSVCRLSGSTCSPEESQGASLRMAVDKGAAAVFYAYKALLGNAKYQSYPLPTTVPTFVLGSDDGHAIEELVARAPVGDPPRVRIRMDVQMVPNLKSALVWGTLPGQTDETIYVIGHRDGWFDGATDNASGIASMIGLSEYFCEGAKWPQALIAPNRNRRHNWQWTWRSRRGCVAVRSPERVVCENSSDAQRRARSIYDRVSLLA